MNIFYTSSTEHLAKNIGLKKGLYLSKKFCDGEIFVNVLEDVKDQEVWVIASTKSPSDNIIELCFLLDALEHCGAKINLFFVYFGYARQDNIIEQEAVGAKVVSNFIKQFKLNQILILHPHSAKLNEFLSFKSVIPYELYNMIAHRADVITAPDKGAHDICKKIAEKNALEFIWLEKHRPAHDIAEIIKINGNEDAIKDKNVIIIDDIISTANTIAQAAKYLINIGAASVDVIATHGVFCPGSIEKIEESVIENVYVTNSIPMKQKSQKINVIDLAKFIESVINNKKAPELL